MQSRPANITLLRLCRIYDKYTRQGIRKVVCNEGGTRSAKTWDAIYFIIWYCLENTGLGKRIRIFRNTLINCRTSVYEDFKNIMQREGLFDAKCSRESPSPRYELFGNTIYFHGLDDWTKLEGLPSDVLFFNEALEIEKKCFDTLLMRCTELCIMDWNPRYTVHWCFDLEKRSDTIFTHSTFRDNHYLPDSIVDGIEAYEPTPENIAAGTADEWRWKVYGLGIRAAQDGLIYPNVEWIDDLPDAYDYEALGMDYGFTNDPTALVHCRMCGDNLYCKLLYYSPTADANLLYDMIAKYFTNERETELYAYVDTADKYAKNADGMTLALNARGLQCIKTKKGAGSIIDGIEAVKGFKIHIVRNQNAENEQASYCYAKVNGIQINAPEDANNHMWDAIRYVVQNEFHYRRVAALKK